MTYLKYCHLFYQPIPEGSFFSRLIHINQKSLDLIYSHPFNQELLAGTLPKAKFGHYLRDDFLYLRVFAKVLHTLAARTQIINPSLSLQLTQLAHEVVSSEHSMQLKYSAHFKDFHEHQMGTAITHYSDYLLTASTQAKIPEALCSILPCFWIYYQLGMLKSPKEIMTDHPYDDWIATYSSDEFVRITLELAATVNSLVNKSHQSKQLRLVSAFTKSVSYELDFFNEVYLPPVNPPSNASSSCQSPT
ncbi:TenA family protein [Legionella worsleiensis]|uniref:Thiaminase-2 n=1 Tax=Legionella worsleiensis TaxID=45076 RepID=A0A0W1A416_9GAMM|nr:TenA family protein [Legionella worsleiensis]KTD76114.1 Thiaminase-2 [Legionella worsleiensis]